jgi:hypothetical protein
MAAWFGASLVLAAALASCASHCPDNAGADAPKGSTGAGYGYAFEPESAASAAASPVPASLPLGPGGRLYPEAIGGVIRIHFGAFLTCYGAGLAREPGLTGTLFVEIAFGEDGVPTRVTSEPASSLHDEPVIDCILDKFQKLRFPTSHGGPIKALYPVVLAPSDLAAR